MTPQPFLSIYTPTYRRPTFLARNLASVEAQTAVADIEQIVVVDHLGIGIAGMFGRIPAYAAALHGDYVCVLADDDMLAAPDVVARLRAVVEAHDQPPVVIVRCQKADLVFPTSRAWPPACGEIDLACVVARADIWRAHVTAYGWCYEGDYQFAAALAAAGYPAVFDEVLFVTGFILAGQRERPSLTARFARMPAVCP